MLTPSQRPEVKAYKRAWYLKNKVHTSLLAQKRYLLNRDAILKKLKEQYANNPEKIKQKTRTYYKANRLKALAAQKQYRDLNKIKTSNCSKRWRDKHHGHVLLVKKRYRDTNPLKIRAHIHRRLARQKAAEGRWTERDIEQLLIAQNKRCYWCCVTIGKFHIDHVVPLSRGGSNWPNNIRLSCKECNLSKNKALAMDFTIRMLS